jgi:hypothetical protein
MMRVQARTGRSDVEKMRQRFLRRKEQKKVKQDANKQLRKVSAMMYKLMAE